jgi:hypothetical protein
VEVGERVPNKTAPRHRLPIVLSNQ